MGVGCPGYRCRWVRGRLPLLTGGELTGADRRRVERHLIACPGCRQHERSLAGALGALQAAAAVAPVGPVSPSLWPALSRQIREARHEPAPSWLDDLARLVFPPARLRPVLVTAAGLALAVVTAAGVQAWMRPGPGAAAPPIEFVAFPL
ncbi:MAG: zf-HC2 domain-containing protein, partial [Planctomycetia bacterium]|nr:zf-HC2 domain-containing protein [Planctomycetia bacterium]